MDVIAILKQHFRPVNTVTINQSVDDAIDLMAAEKVRALIVTDQELPVGIFTERDVLRYYLLDKKRPFADVRLKSAVTGRLISADATDEISDVIRVMIKSGLEYIAVMEDGNLIGLLAFKDLVKVQLESLTEEVHQLNGYINDLHEAGQD